MAQPGHGGTRVGGDELLASASVLIVDDHPANVALLTSIVRSMGIGNVHGITDPTQAVKRCREVGADVMLLDLHMPGMDGFAVLSALRDHLGDDVFLPVVVLTADQERAVRDRALAAGANDFLTKPFDLTEVTLRVRNLLETRALYRDVQRRNVALQAEADRREAEARLAAQARRQSVARIKQALSTEALAMVFQPIMNLRTGEVVGVEALARFDCLPRRPPDQWFEEAASIGLGCELELAACRAAIAQLDDVPPNAFLSVNVSPSTAIKPEMMDFLDGLPGNRIVMELTEHSRIDDYDVLLPALESMRDRGVRVAVDDTGAGYAGLRHILQLRPDILKLDTTLTRGVDADPARRALTTGLLAFAREIGAVVIAEGIETAGELGALRELHVVLGQGFHLARPGPLPLPSSRL